MNKNLKKLYGGINKDNNNNNYNNNNYNNSNNNNDNSNINNNTGLTFGGVHSHVLSAL